MTQISLSPELQQQLFDRGQFRAELTITSNPVNAYKKCLTKAQQLLNDWFNQEMDIELLVHSRAWLVDQILTLAWEHLDWGENPGISLLAVGGYGRSELHPNSDIDILILLENDDHERYRTQIETFLMLLWDINLQVGQSVRTIDECTELAQQELSIMTNLLESRTLSGSAQLRHQLLNNIEQSKIWPSRDFLKAKYEEQRARHRKFNDTEYNLEPNLKSSPGGLRDLHMISWVTKRHFGATVTLEQLVNEGFLTEPEYHILIRGRNFLWRVRWGLHQLTGRCEDRLLFDYQRSLAEQFGFRDTKANLAVEQFMQRYYLEVMAVGQLIDLLLQHFDDYILSADAPTSITPLNERFQIRNNYLEVTSPQVFAETPSALLELFVLLTQHPKILGARASTIRLMREHRHLIDNNFRNAEENTQLFLQLMQAPYALTATLRRMLRYGLLGRYLPEFGNIIGQMQHDLFHIYTVDAHTLLLIKFLRSFSYEESVDQFPIASSLIKTLPKPELLYIAGLYHDIAKGRGGNHSELGADDAAQFCERHQLPPQEQALIVWLVRHHLVMSTTAQRKDLNDPSVINEFARFAGNQERLDYLYCLTVADINATNPKLWNSWRASLLRQLYTGCKQALRRGLEHPMDQQERIQETQQEAIQLLREYGVSTSAMQQLWLQLGEEYFLRHNAEEITWHTAAIIQHGDQQEPLVLVRETAANQAEAGTQVFLYTPDYPNLFAVATSALDQQNLTIHDARIITSTSGFSLDTFVVLQANGMPIGQDPGRIHRIKSRLQKAIAQPERYTDIIQRRTPRRLKHFSRPSEVVISHDEINHRTLIEVFAIDRPGLLAQMGKTFMELGLVIQAAKIATLGERVEDVFFVTDKNLNPIEEVEECQKIRHTLCCAIDRFAKRQ